MNIQQVIQGGMRLGGLALSAPATTGTRFKIGDSSTSRETTNVADTKFLKFYLPDRQTDVSSSIIVRLEHR